MNNKKKIWFFLSFGIIASMFFGCASSSALKNKASIEYHTLKNGIPLIIEKNDSNRIYSLNIVAKGGIAHLNKEYSGIENAVFSMMNKGSLHYSFDDIKKLEYETQSGISAWSTQNGSVLSLNCIDYYFKDLFPVFSDTFLNPTFPQMHYETMMRDFYQGIQSKMNNPFSLMQYSVSKTLYKDHPYETEAFITKDSINSITIEALKNYHKKLLNAKKLSIVAVGNFNTKTLINTLNKAFGDIPYKNTEKKEINIPPIETAGDPVIITNESAKGSGYLGYVFPAPQLNSPDTIPCILAGKIYNDILFSIVREKYGACYSIGCYSNQSEAPYSLLYVYKASDLENIVKRINEAKDLLEKGKLIETRDAITGEYSYNSIEERLESYKNAYINSLFSATQTNRGIASLLIKGELSYNEPERYLKLIDKIRAVTASDIEKSIKTYYTSNLSRWIVVTSKEDKQRLPF